MTDDAREIDFYRRQCDDAGRRVVQLLEEQTRVRRVAKRSIALARLIREAYPLSRVDAPVDEIATRFLQITVNAVGVDSASILRYEPAKERLTALHAVGPTPGQTPISLSLEGL